MQLRASTPAKLESVKLAQSMIKALVFPRYLVARVRVRRSVLAVTTWVTLHMAHWKIRPQHSAKPKIQLCAKSENGRWGGEGGKRARCGEGGLMGVEKSVELVAVVLCAVGEGARRQNECLRRRRFVLSWLLGALSLRLA